MNVQHWLILGHLNTIFSNTMSMATTPIASVILFTLGYGFHLHLSQLKPLLALSLVRIILCGAIVGSFFLFFPGLMAVKVFLAGVLLYFACPTGFPVPLQIGALCKDEDDESFISAFISIFIVLAMVVYTFITLDLMRT